MPEDLNQLDEASRRHRRAASGDPLASLPPALYPGRSPLAGPRAALEPIDQRRHAEGLFASGHPDAAAADLWTYMPYGPFADLAEMTAWLRGRAALADPLFYAIRDRQGGGLAGMASFLRIQPNFGVIEIGNIWFGPAYQNQALTTEALYLMMHHAMEELQYRRFEWKCDALNRASRLAALRLGFRFEGVFYNHMIIKGRNRDTAWYALLDSEWPALRENFETWLAADNFDAAGRQRSSLGEMNRALW
jgi:RimJ/RimL family protein N-acetyltransferase